MKIKAARPANMYESPKVSMSSGRRPARRFEYMSLTVCPSTRSGGYDVFG